MNFGFSVDWTLYELFISILWKPSWKRRKRIKINNTNRKKKSFKFYILCQNWTFIEINGTFIIWKKKLFQNILFFFCNLWFVFNSNDLEYLLSANNWYKMRISLNAIILIFISNTWLKISRITSFICNIWTFGWW